jgi:hypothetical protein
VLGYAAEVLQNEPTKIRLEQVWVMLFPIDQKRSLAGEWKGTHDPEAA